MKKTATIDEYRFDSFSEMVSFLKDDPDSRTIDFGRNLINYVAMFAGPGGKTGNNRETFGLVRLYGEGDDDFYVESLEDYFDGDDRPLDGKFAEDFDISDFVGHDRHA